MDDRDRRSRFRQRLFPRVVVLFAVWAGVSGCLGPKAVRYTRLRYNEVVRDTNDEQLLINIVRLRYADSPVFIDLPNITSQFEVAGHGNYLGGYGNQTPGPGEPRVRRSVAARHADPELPPARGARDRQGTLDPAVGRPVHRGQWRGESSSSSCCSPSMTSTTCPMPPGPRR